MSEMRVRLLIALTCLLTCLSSAVAAQEALAGLEQYLRTVGLGTKDLASAARGRAVVKLLPTSSNRDVAVFGMIGVGVSRDSVVAYALDPPRFLAARGRRFGVFANPPTMADVRDVAFDGSEYRDLRRCRPGDCVAKLPASEMSTFIGRIDWSASDAKARADQQLRDLLLRLVSDYAAGGNEAMVVYDDAAHAVRAGDVFAELLAQSTNLYASAPALERYLTTYPASRPPGARD